MFRARPRVIWANRFLGHMRKYNAIYRRPPTYVLWFYQHSTASIYILTVHSIMLSQTVSDDRKNEPFPGNLHIYYRISPQPLCLADEAPENPGPGAGVSWWLLTSQHLSGPEQHLMLTEGDSRLLILSWQTFVAGAGAYQPVHTSDYLW